MSDCKSAESGMSVGKASSPRMIDSLFKKVEKQVRHASEFVRDKTVLIE